MMITSKPFGTMPDGTPISEFVLCNRHGCELKLITLGGIVTSLLVPDRNGMKRDIVLGFDNLGDYLKGHPYFGAITGRVAGRITAGRFTLEGQAYTLAINDPPNHLHGGKIGFDKRVWDPVPSIDPNGDASIRLSYSSPDGEEGYPGNVNVTLTYTLTDDNSFIITHEATTDRTTPLNITHHSYFNLAGEGSGTVHSHQLEIFAEEYAPADETMALQGCLRPVAQDGNDFNRPRRLIEAIPRLFKNHGNLYKLRRTTKTGLELAARASCPESGIVMEVPSTEDWLQFYTGISLDGTLVGKSGNAYVSNAGFCLECEGYPNAVNHPEIGDSLLRPGEPCRQSTVYRFRADGPLNF